MMAKVLLLAKSVTSLGSNLPAGHDWSSQSGQLRTGSDRSRIWLNVVEMAQVKHSRVDMQWRLSCGLRMRREGRERFPCHWVQRKPLDNDPDMHHGTYVTHVSWFRSGSLTRAGGENVLGNPEACTISNFMYLAKGPYNHSHGNYNAFTYCFIGIITKHTV